jgi:CRISPR-associated protein Cmr3
MGLLIKPVEPMFFRWSGEYSPNFSGPMNKGVSEPLPLMSTIAGALYKAVKGLDRLKPGEEVEQFKGVLGELWGPLIYVKGKRKKGGNKGEYLLVHQYPGKLLVLRLEESGVVLNRIKKEEKGGDDENEADEIIPKQVSKIGVGRDLAKRSAMDHLLYSSQFVDFYATIRGEFENVEKWGIYVETGVKYEGVLELGGEGRLAKVEKFDLKIPESKGELSILLSPALLSVGSGKWVLIDDILNEKVENYTLKDIVCGAKIGVIGTGFNTSMRARRPLYPALMPGSILKVRDRKIGELKELGWGSLLGFSDENGCEGNRSR